MRFAHILLIFSLSINVTFAKFKPNDTSLLDDLSELKSNSALDNSQLDSEEVLELSFTPTLDQTSKKIVFYKMFFYSDLVKNLSEGDEIELKYGLRSLDEINLANTNNFGYINPIFQELKKKKKVRRKNFFKYINFYDNFIPNIEYGETIGSFKVESITINPDDYLRKNIEATINLSVDRFKKQLEKENAILFPNISIKSKIIKEREIKPTKTFEFKVNFNIFIYNN